jgi:hypothetical protein
MADEEGPSETVLAETPGRALKFLSALSNNAALRAILATKGYTDEEHQRGFALLFKASGYSVSAPSPLPMSNDARDAMLVLDAWDEPNFRIIRAALEHRHPAQCKFVFQDLEPATGAGAILSVSTLLDRLDTLEQGKERQATRKEDHAALETLATREYTPKERRRLRELVERASAPVAPILDAPKLPSASDEERRETLRQLWIWYREWSETARGLIKRRDQLILLGLAKRKKPEKKKKNETPQ